MDRNGIVREVNKGAPILNEKDEKGNWKLAVRQLYSPILSGLKKGE
ncbi:MULTISPECIES: hypothetical protein [Pontibacter]|nr:MULTISPECIES: hypothetical protein [Pontibacter]